MVLRTEGSVLCVDGYLRNLGRGSYVQAIDAGSWVGFSCSLQDFSQASFKTKVNGSSRDVLQAITNVKVCTEDREKFLMALVEHEVMHEGQIIRHLYGLGCEIPESVKWA